MDPQKSASTSTSSTSISQTTEDTAIKASGMPMPDGLTRSPRPSIGKALPLGFDHLASMSPGGLEQELVAAGMMANSKTEGRPWWRRTRMHVALLGLAIAVVNCYAQATFCIAIVEMVYPADYVSKPGGQANPLANVTSARLASETVTLQDQSCPIEFKYRHFYEASRFPDESKSPSANSSQQDVDVSNRFQWDATQQGLLLGAFAFGTAPLQIVAGRLSEIYGSKWVLLAGCVGTAITNLTIPYIAHFSFLLLLANRFLMGITQAGMEPGVMCLLADWLTPQEASLFISMSLFAMCVGFFLGLLGSSLILGLGYGWPMAFYVSGGLNLGVAIVWHFYADSWPHASKCIGQEELAFITSEQRKERKFATNDLKTNISSKPPLAGAQNHIKIISFELPPASCTPAPALAEPDDPARAPWLNILSTRSVWAFIICKISVRWCADVISNMMPTYLANVLHLSIEINGLFMSISTALFMVSAFVAGWLANEIFLADKPDKPTLISIKKKTRVRKAFQSMASFGSAVCLLLMTLYDCDIVFSMSMLLVLSFCLVMGSGGELQIPYDMTSRYPGTLHGMACTLSVSGWLAPPLIGLVLGDQPNSRFRWSIVWNSTAALTLVGGLAFVLFADSSPRDFDKRRVRTKSANENGDLEGCDEMGKSNSHRDEGYVNGALNTSSCESSPRAVRDILLPHAKERPSSSLTPATGVTERPNQKQNSIWHQVDFARERNQEPLSEPLRGESSFPRKFTSGDEVNDGSIRGGGASDSGKTIALRLSSSALIEDYQPDGDASSATMINDARGDPAADSIVYPADRPNGEAGAISTNEKDLSSTRAPSLLVASDVEQAAEGEAPNAAAHRASLEPGLPSRACQTPPERSNQAPDSRCITHL